MQVGCESPAHESLYLDFMRGGGDSEGVHCRSQLVLCLDRSLPVSAQKIEDGGRGQDILEIQDTRFEGLIEAEQTLYVVFLLSWSLYFYSELNCNDFYVFPKLCLKKCSLASNCRVNAGLELAVLHHTQCE